MPKTRAMKQEEAIRAILRDAIRSGVEPDARDLDELRRLGIPPATVAKAVELAGIGVDKFDSGETLSLNEANEFSTRMADQLTSPLATRNQVDDDDRALADRLQERQRSGVRVDRRGPEPRPAHAVNR